MIASNEKALYASLWTATPLVALILFGSMIGSLSFGGLRFVDVYLLSCFLFCAAYCAIHIAASKGNLSRDFFDVAICVVVLLVLPLVVSQLTRSIRQQSAYPAQFMLGYAEIFGCFSIFFFSALAPWHSNAFWRLVLTMGAVALTPNLVLWFFGDKFVGFSGLTNHKNVLGGVSMSVFWLGLIAIRENDLVQSTRRLAFTVLCLSFFLTIVSGSRASQLGLLTAMAALFFLAKTSSPSLLFLCTTVVIALIPFAYLNIGKLPEFDVVERFFESTTGDNLYSGRQTLWPEAFKSISEAPFLGSGRSWHYTFRDGSKNHAHNLYIAKLAQCGIVGLVLLLTLFYRLFVCFGRNRSNVGQALLLGFMIHQCFEVNFAIGGMPIGVAAMTVFGCVFSKSMKPQIGGIDKCKPMYVAANSPSTLSA